MQELATKIKACDCSQPYIYVSYSTRDWQAVYSDVIALQVVVVDLEEVDNLDIEKYVNGQLYSLFGSEYLSEAEAERMRKYRDKYNNRVDDARTRYNLCEIILEILKDQEAGQVPYTEDVHDRVAYVSKML